MWTASILHLNGFSFVLNPDVKYPIEILLIKNICILIFIYIRKSPNKILLIWFFEIIEFWFALWSGMNWKTAMSIYLLNLYENCTEMQLRNWYAKNRIDYRGEDFWGRQRRSALGKIFIAGWTGFVLLLW